MARRVLAPSSSQAPTPPDRNTASNLALIATLFLNGNMNHSSSPELTYAEGQQLLRKAHEIICLNGRNRLRPCVRGFPDPASSGAGLREWCRVPTDPVGRWTGVRRRQPLTVVR